MRILQLCSARELGGGERHLADLANALARRGHDVYAAVIPSSPLLSELSELPQSNIVRMPMRNSLNLRSASRLAHFVREQRIEIVHAHLARDYPLAALVTARGRASLVLTRHVLFKISRIHKLTLRNAARVIAVSDAVADGLRSQQIFDADKIVRIYNGIDIDRFRTDPTVARQAHQPWRIGMIGHLAPIKGQEDFLRAAAIVCAARDDVEVVIAGEDKSVGKENRQRIEALIAQLVLNLRVQLLGWVDKVEELLATLDLFVSPARAEPFGLTIVEAMAAGVPVIATMSEGAREIIDAGETGKLVPIGDVEALAAAMLQLLSDDNARKRLRENAERVVGERFTLERMVEATERVYCEVVEAANGKHASVTAVPRAGRN